MRAASQEEVSKTVGLNSERSQNGYFMQAPSFEARVAIAKKNRNGLDFCLLTRVNWQMHRHLDKQHPTKSIRNVLDYTPDTRAPVSTHLFKILLLEVEVTCLPLDHQN